jgi:hypothetical protein
MKRKIFKGVPLFLAFPLFFTACSKKDSTTSPQPKNPASTPAAFIDRFSASAGHLQVRTAANGLPAANTPVNFDQAPFITRGFSPTGTSIQYYNFDIQPTTPAPIYVLYKAGDSTPVSGQLNIVDVIPGVTGYNDFWQINKVAVPANYVANTVTSYAEIAAAGYIVTPTSGLVNCPVVPNGSTATLRFNSSEDPGLTKGWYKDSVVTYFNFAESPLSVTAQGDVPEAAIFVSFTIDPNQPNGGPASGFKTETGSDQTHNVVSVLPQNAGYSPLWVVAVYDNTAFSNVSNLSTAMAAPLLVPNAGTVNCPVVKVQ